MDFTTARKKNSATAAQRAFWAYFGPRHLGRGLPEQPARAVVEAGGDCLERVDLAVAARPKVRLCPVARFLPRARQLERRLVEESVARRWITGVVEDACFDCC